MGLVWPEALRLCFETDTDTDTGQACPTGSSPAGRDSLVIEILGAAGGAITAVLAVRKKAPRRRTACRSRSPR
jgi:hypothetical protein